MEIRMLFKKEKKSLLSIPFRSPILQLRRRDKEEIGNTVQFTIQESPTGETKEKKSKMIIRKKKGENLKLQKARNRMQARFSNRVSEYFNVLKRVMKRINANTTLATNNFITIRILCKKSII